MDRMFLTAKIDNVLHKLRVFYKVSQFLSLKNDLILLLQEPISSFKSVKLASHNYLKREHVSYKLSGDINQISEHAEIFNQGGFIIGNHNLFYEMPILLDIIPDSLIDRIVIVYDGSHVKIDNILPSDVLCFMKDKFIPIYNGESSALKRGFAIKKIINAIENNNIVIMYPSAGSEENHNISYREMKFLPGLMKFYPGFKFIIEKLSEQSINIPVYSLHCESSDLDTMNRITVALSHLKNQILGKESHIVCKQGISYTNDYLLSGEPLESYYLSNLS